MLSYGFNRPVRPIAIVQSDTTDYLDGGNGGGMLAGILVLGEGNLVVKNDKGATLTYTFLAAVAGQSFPFMVPGPFTHVMAATTLDDAEMIGYQYV